MIAVEINWREALQNSLDYDDFRKWLAHYKPETLAGEICESTRCPLAHYLTDCLGVEVSVCNSSAAVHAGVEWLPDVTLPDWAKAFVRAVDRSRDSNVGTVTHAECLRILDGIPA